MSSDSEKRHQNDPDSDADNEKDELLSSSRDSSPSESRSASPEPAPAPAILDPRFNPPAPSPLKRTALLLFIAVLVWIAFYMRAGVLEAKRRPQVIYASRYSKEHKYRPAASPIITETLKDGRIRLRGAIPPTATPTPPVVKKKNGGGKTKKRAKGKKKAAKRQP